MGMVTDIFWTCPGCGSREKAQAYGGYDDPDEFPVDAVPASRGLKWNPPCGQCGHYRLVMPEVMVACIPVAFPGDEAPTTRSEQMDELTPTDDQCDLLTAKVLDKIAAKHSSANGPTHAVDLNPSLTEHHSLRRGLVRAAYMLGAMVEAERLRAALVEIARPEMRNAESMRLIAEMALGA